MKRIKLGKSRWITYDHEMNVVYIDSPLQFVALKYSELDRLIRTAPKKKIRKKAAKKNKN